MKYSNMRKKTPTPDDMKTSIGASTILVFVFLTSMITMGTTPGVQAVQVSSFTLSFNISLNDTMVSNSSLSELEANFKSLSFTGYPNPAGYEVYFHSRDATSSLLGVTLGAAVVAGESTSEAYFNVVRNTFRSTELLTTTSSSSLWTSVILQSPSFFAFVDTTLALSELKSNTPCSAWETGMCSDGTPLSDATGATFAASFNSLVSDTSLLSMFCVAAGITSITDASTQCTEVSIVSNTPGSTGTTFAVFSFVESIDTMASAFSIVRNARYPEAAQYMFSSSGFTNLVLRQPATSTMTTAVETVIYTASEFAISQSGSGESRVTDIECELTDYWWMIFLIMLIPVSVILLRGVYRKGSSAGVKKAKQQQQLEQDRQIQLQQLVLNSQQELQQNNQQELQYDPNTGAATLPVLK